MSAAITVHFFKPSGKWYTTETMDWLQEEGDDSRLGLLRSLRCAVGTRLWGMTAVCLEPGGPNAHPVMVLWEEDAL